MEFGGCVGCIGSANFSSGCNADDKFAPISAIGPTTCLSLYTGAFVLQGLRGS